MSSLHMFDRKKCCCFLVAYEERKDYFCRSYEKTYCYKTNQKDPTWNVTFISTRTGQPIKTFNWQKGTHQYTDEQDCFSYNIQLIPTTANVCRESLFHTTTLTTPNQGCKGMYVLFLYAFCACFDLFFDIELFNYF